MAKSAQLQIRVTTRQKAQLKRLAAAAGQDVSAYVLSRVLAEPYRAFKELVAALGGAAEPRHVLAELNDLLSSLTAGQIAPATAHADIARLSPLLRNYVAAMVEQAAERAGVQAPAWTAAVEPLDAPWFATPLKGLRLHLLRAAPVAFKRRNIFVDSALGARV